MNKKELNIFIGISRARKKVSEKSNRLFMEYNLTESQFAVLEVLYHKGALSIGEIQKKILSSSGTIPVVIRNLEKRNYITRNQDEKDKRKYIIDITLDGKKLIDEIFPKNEKIIKEIFNVLDDNEKNEFIKLLKKI